MYGTRDRHFKQEEYFGGLVDKKRDKNRWRLSVLRNKRGLQNQKTHQTLPLKNKSIKDIEPSEEHFLKNSVNHQKHNPMAI